jgi:hypothetical protein
MILDLTNEVIGLAVLAKNDTASRGIIGEAADLQLQLEDFDGYLNTARLLRQFPYPEGRYRSMSRNLVCYLLEDRKLDDARGFASRLIDGTSPEEGDWTRAHFAMQLLRLPNPLRDSLKNIPMDSAALRRESFAIARSIATPEVTTDIKLALAGFLIGARDSAHARRLLRTADSARKLIVDRDRATSRAAMIAGVGVRLGEWDLATRMVDQLSSLLDFKDLAEGSAFAKLEGSDPPELTSFRTRILERYLSLVKANPDKRVRDHLYSQLRVRIEYGGRKALADSLMLPPSPTRKDHLEQAPGPEYDRLMIRAIEAAQQGNINEAERALRALPDPERTGLGARAMINLAHMAHPKDSLTIRKRGLEMLLKSSRLKSRDEVLAEVARDRLAMWGDNEMAIDIVNEIRDVKLARQTLADIGQSTMANLNPPKLRKLVERIRNNEVRDQVLFRLMISMLLTKGATPGENSWGLAIADSIRTPDLRSAARFEVAKYYWFRGDTVRARGLFLETLHGPIDYQNQWDRSTVISSLLAANAKEELLSWARSKPEPTAKARSLLHIIYPLRWRIPGPSNPRATIISNGPDGCRRDF